jgi:hypothetical protein
MTTRASDEALRLEERLTVVVPELMWGMPSGWETWR